MTGRQRIREVVRGKVPDCVPIDFGATRVTSIHAKAYNDLVKYLGIGCEGARVYDVPQMLALPEPAILDFFEADTVQLPRLRPAPSVDLRISSFTTATLADGSAVWYPGNFKPVQEADGSLVLVDGSGNRTNRLAKGGFYFERLFHPLRGATSEKDIDRIDFHEFIDGEELFLKTELRKLRSGSRAIVGQFGGNFLERGNRFFGMDEFLMNLLSEPKLVEHFFDRVLEATIEDFDRYASVVGEGIDVIQLNDDLGVQNGPMISPELYRHLIKPYHNKLYQHIRHNSGMALFLHSCGGIYELIPDLIESGVQILNPIQYRAAGMDPGRLKTEFGKDLVFWGGGCDTQVVLPNGSLAEIREETERMIDTLAAGGGYVFSHVHNIQPGIAPEKIVAMYEVIKRKRHLYS